ncbi:hypothetical protein LXL04_034240 [Taraxacum kok-saghyz]
MDMAKKFRMNAGIGDASYASNSTLQKTAIKTTKEIIERAIRDFLYKSKEFPEMLSIADFGCSSGPNALLMPSMLIDVVAKISLEMSYKTPEIQINLNDLPSNDFNTTFGLLQEFQEKIIYNIQPPLSCYFTGVPGSFYARVFPANTLHFVYCSYSLHWLSQLPEVGKINKGSINLSSTTPKSVAMAFYEQYHKDFLAFLRCRAEEVVAGGHMILMLAGRRNDDPCFEESNYLFGLLYMVLDKMVAQGLADEEKLHAFNVPVFKASPTEIQNIVEEEGSFKINLLDVSDMKLTEYKISTSDNNEASHTEDVNEGRDLGLAVAMGARATLESLVVDHFGQEIANDAFLRLEKALIDGMSSNMNEAIITTTIFLTKKRDH